MVSVKIAVILSVVFSLLFLLSQATRVPLLPDATTAVDFREVPEDFDPTTAELIPAEDADPTALTASIEKITSEHPIPEFVEGFDHVDLSLRRPVHRHFRRHRCHHHHHDRHDRHGHRFHGVRIVPYGNDMIPLPKGGEVDAGSEAEGREGRMEWPLATEWEGERRRTRKNKEHKKKRADEEDSDSDSDDEEEMEMGKKELKFGRRMGRKEQRGWLNWFRAMWD